MSVPVYRPRRNPSSRVSVPVPKKGHVHPSTWQAHLMLRELTANTSQNASLFDLHRVPMMLRYSEACGKQARAWYTCRMLWKLEIREGTHHKETVFNSNDCLLSIC